MKEAINKMNVFKGSDDYVVTDELMNAVNVSIALKKPLLIKGEPGTGKTMLAEAISQSLDMPLIIWSIKSTTKAQDGLYVYDTVQRLYDSQFGEGDVKDIVSISSWASLAKRSRVTNRLSFLLMKSTRRI